MLKILTICLVTLIGSIVVDDASAEPAPCATCEAPKQQTMRERIKQDREKYDRENLKTTARPWDGLNLGRQPSEKKPASVE